ncbi:uncharacterized protein LOC131947818 isoform X2 [Physella acuta]|uniref:uncharacterized protein LOC131947818 isoform X2 n=1 Tax=Physella acuta TaxID=109671 RepID=UPI0027DB338F|nr:uncharacterized protein LOC131947818 isoform X2 [Physella acuta]
MASGTSDVWLSSLVLLTSIVLLRGASTDDKDWMYNMMTSLNKQRPEAPRDQYSPLWDYVILGEEPTRNTLVEDALKRLFPATGQPGTDRKTTTKRFGFGGLICCNHPPTRPPQVKQTKRFDPDRAIDMTRLKSMILSTILRSFIEEESNGNLEPRESEAIISSGQESGDPNLHEEKPLWEEPADTKDSAMNRRGVKMVDKTLQGPNRLEKLVDIGQQMLTNSDPHSK